MATTDFLPFATSGGANVATQADYAADASTTNGYSSGIVHSTLFNKVLRQAAFMAAMIGNFEVGQGISQPDDGNLTNAVTNFKNALTAYVGAAKSYVSVTGSTGTLTLTAAQTQSQVINIGGTLTGNVAAKFSSTSFTGAWLINNSTSGAFSLTIGYATGTTVTVPQGSSVWVWGDGTNVTQLSGTNYTTSAGSNGYQKLPTNIIIQWGTFSVGASGTNALTFPITFNTACYVVLAIPIIETTIWSNGLSTSGANIGNGGVATSVYWVAIGQ